MTLRHTTRLEIEVSETQKIVISIAFRGSDENHGSRILVLLFLKNEDYQKSPKAVQEIYQKHVDKSYLKNGDREKANEAIKALFGHSKNHYWIHRADLY